jgi:trimeric autotransporter adhesin
MKAKQIIGRLVMGCALALSLVTVSYGQITPPTPPPNTNPPPTAEQIAAALAAAEAARWTQYTNDFLPWVTAGETLFGIGPANAITREQQQIENLQSLTTEFADAAGSNETAVATFLTASGFDPFTILPDGSVAAITRIENGIPVSYATCNNTLAADTISTDELWPGGSTGLGLTGTNVNIGVWDGGDVRLLHQEFTTGGQRVTDIDGTSTLGTSDHATHVTGTIGAKGVVANAKGMAFNGKIYAADFVQDTAKMPPAVNTNLLRVSNHSYAAQAGWGYASIGGSTYMVWWGDTAISTTEDYNFGFYNSVTREIDRIVYAAPNYLPVWAAANERGTAGAPLIPPSSGYYTFFGTNTIISTASRPNDGNSGYDTLPNNSVAKNILTVGAVNPITGGYSGSNSVVMASFSSWGPTDDGRIKPDVVGDGVDVYSSVATNNSSYAAYSGTSMATPSVAGSVALLTELHRNLSGTNYLLRGSTLKGLTIHTADEAGTTDGPDYQFGYGLANFKHAALLLTNNAASGSLSFVKEVFVPSGDYVEFPVNTAGGAALKATICWTDPAGTPVAASVDPTNRMLINDLDLRIVGNGTTNFPWVLNPASPTSAANKADNDRDNVEQVVVNNPGTNTYLIRITHKGALKNDLGQTNGQHLSILVSGNVATPPVLPVLGSPLVLSNAVALKWESEVGRFYQVQQKAELNSNWLPVTGDISAIKTNTAALVSRAPTDSSGFFRVVQLR